MFAKSAAPFALALSLAASPAAVFAADLSSPSVQVRFGDLNLATPEGVAALHARVGQAVSDLCGGTQFRRSLDDEHAFRTCRSETMADAHYQFQTIIAKAQEAHSRVAMNETTEPAAP